MAQSILLQQGNSLIGNQFIKSYYFKTPQEAFNNPLLPLIPTTYQ